MPHFQLGMVTALLVFMFVVGGTTLALVLLFTVERERQERHKQANVEREALGLPPLPPGEW